MKLQLVRLQSDALATAGELYVDGRRICCTIEDPHRDVKVHGKTRIPAGTYRIMYRTAGGMHPKYAARFPGLHKGMLHLQDVPGFTFVYIHCGNTPADTEGCILVNRRLFKITTQGWQGTGSAVAYKELYPLVAAALDAGEPVTIAIDDRDR